jgi:hypothetical protein
METTAAERSCSVLAYCPECRERRGLHLKHAVLLAELERDADIRVASPICGHAWSLTAEQKKNLRKYFADGLI